MNTDRLIGERAKHIFERAQLSNEVLSRIWTLSDVEQRGELGLTEFIIAMHLLASYKNGSLQALPQTLPAALYGAASRRGASPTSAVSQPPSEVTQVNQTPRQNSSSGFQTVASSASKVQKQQPQSSTATAADEWAISLDDKENFDKIFNSLDTDNNGFITGDQAVNFFSSSRLSEDILAQIWDLADINSEGRLSQDEFAVAMYLVRQQRAKRAGQDVLPQSLPRNLVPPKMRSQQAPFSQPTALSSSSNVAVKKPKPPSEDLFGLDAISEPTPQISQSTGDSLYSATPPPSHGSPQLIHQPQPTFKPFVPSSAFGNAMLTTQAARPMQSNILAQRSTSDDLLGDANPEESKRLTQETSELANLSNQISILTSQMQDVRDKRSSIELDISKSHAQKRDFELRLSQLRSAYDQEVKSVKTLEENLLAVRTEVKKLEHDMVLVDGSYQDLQDQHRRIAEALDSDQRENANLKEKIRQTNLSVNELKSQLEKVRSDARQQRGIVAINKKQLATNEAEQEKLKTETEVASRELEESTNEAADTTRQVKLHTEAQNHSNSMSAKASATSMNPFFRRPQTVSPEEGTTISYSHSNVVSPDQITFDNLFGPPSRIVGLQPNVPQPSFETHPLDAEKDSNHQFLRSPNSVRSFDNLDAQSSFDFSPGAIRNEPIRASEVPPAPPQSRQITSSFLPLRTLQRSDSTSSSVKVAPPASRAGGISGVSTPSGQQSISQEILNKENTHQHFETLITQSGDPNNSQSTADVNPSVSALNEDPGTKGQRTSESIFQLPESASILPVPEEDKKSSTPSSPERLSNRQRKHSDPNRVPGSFPVIVDQPRTPALAKDEFDAAFEKFSNVNAMPENPNGLAVDGHLSKMQSSMGHNEFPPIRELRTDDDSDSDSDHGFDDNFTATSPHQPQNIGRENKDSLVSTQQNNEKNSQASYSPFSVATDPAQSQLPTSNAQKSSPGYSQIVSSGTQAGHHSGSKQFPSEFTEILPSREVPLPSNSIVGLDTAVPTKPYANPGLSSGEAKAELRSQDPVQAATTPVDDFDNEFGDLSEAKEADEKGEDYRSTHKNEFDEFNPVFDSSTPPKIVQSPSSTYSRNNSLHDFESTFIGSGASAKSQSKPEQGLPDQHHDWNSIFAGLETPQNSGVGPEPIQVFHSSETDQNGHQPTSSPISKSARPALPQRGVSLGNEHDDPILKRLTGMGYPRETSLQALEKFDYNIDKVRNSMQKHYNILLTSYGARLLIFSPRSLKAQRSLLLTNLPVIIICKYTSHRFLLQINQTSKSVFFSMYICLSSKTFTANSLSFM